MNPFLQKILAATGLTRRGHLAEATQAIRKALAGAADAREAAPARGETASASASPAAPTASTEVFDGLVREIEPIGQATPARVEAEAETAAEAIVVEREPAVVEERRRTGRFIESSFTAAAGTRSFKLFEPDGFEGRALPLVVMLHGCTQDPDDFAAGTRMNELAQEQGLFVLYPAQAPRSNAHKCWNWFVPGDQRRGQGEPALLAGMTRHVMETHPVDADRVWVAGLSAGGAMAAILAREYPDLFAAAGVHSGLPPGAAHDVVSAFSAMKSGASGTVPGWPASVGNAPLNPLAAWPGTAAPEAVEAMADAAAAQGAPVIVFHGDADSTVNVVNGHHVVDAALGSTPSQASRESGAPAGGDGRAFTRTLYHPAAPTGAGAPPAEPAGDAASRAEHWVVHGAGHAWSGGAAAGSFTDSNGPDASREMLRFFAEHPRRRPTVSS